MLNSASHVTEPSFFSVEEANRVEYAGIDSCLASDEFSSRKLESEPTTVFDEAHPRTTPWPAAGRLVTRNGLNMEAVKRNFDAKRKPREKILKPK